MPSLRKRLFAAAGYNTIYFGSGRKEFDPSKPMPSFETYLKDTAEGTMKQLPNVNIDEGIIGSFMSGRFLKQANLPGFLPFMVPELLGKPCTGVEGACGTGGRAIAMASRSVLSEMSDSVFVAGFEVQNTMKAVYGADVLAGAAYYDKERKKGGAFFFPALFAERAGAYFDKFGIDQTRQGMAKWYEQSIQNARKNPKAQEYHNKEMDLFALGMIKPNADQFIPFLNLYNCSKVSDGASSLVILSEEGLQRSDLKNNEVVEIVGIGEAEGNITEAPKDLTELSNTRIAVHKALDMAGIKIDDIAVLEVHDCFGITALMSLEAIGLVEKGKAFQAILEGETSIEGKIPTNLSGGLTGFGHPTGASGVRQLVDLLHQLTRKASNQAKIQKPYGMMISMGGNDKTVTCIIVKAFE
jgi:acetyl-CoA C-acetyltransferase